MGGIVGQMEPYLHLSLRDDLIAKLRAELDKLNALVSSTLDDVDSTNDHISSRLDSVSAYTNAAVDDADSLAGQTTDFIDKNIGSVNGLTDRAKTVTDALPDILKALETAEKHAGDAIDALRQCDKDLTLNAADRAELSAASGRIQTNSAKLKAAANSLNTAVNDLKEYLDGSKTWNTDAVRRLLSDALAALSDAMSVMAEISTDMAKIAAILSDFLKDAAPKAHDDIQQALDALSDAAASLDTTTGKTRRLIEDLNARGSLTFYPLGDGYQDTLDSLFTNLRSTMDELDALSDGLSADGSTLTADLRAVNDQMNAVVNLCLDIFVDMTDADASDIFEDTSDENTDAVTFGKVRGCTNYGAVDADLNVGGIAGAMAIEYELDPEGDQKESSSVFDRVYETKAVVQHCVNRGSISGKKDCIGGIVGEMDLGEKIQKENWFDFDVVVASPDMMGVVGRLGKVLGPKGLMPSPKAGTVTPDVAKAVQESKAGKVEYRLDKTNIIHCPIGKVSFGPEKLAENFNALMGAIIKAKPAASKGQYIKSCVAASTMGPGVKMNTAKI